MFEAGVVGYKGSSLFADALREACSCAAKNLYYEPALKAPANSLGELLFGTASWKGLIVVEETEKGMRIRLDAERKQFFSEDTLDKLRLMIHKGLERMQREGVLKSYWIIW